MQSWRGLYKLDPLNGEADIVDKCQHEGYRSAVSKIQFGEIISEARMKAGLSLRELSARVGIEYSRLSRIEHGSRPAPALSDVRALAGVLDLDIEDLLVAAGNPREVVDHLLWLERLRCAQDMSRDVDVDRLLRSPLQEKNRFRVSVVERDGALCTVRFGEDRLLVLSFLQNEELTVEIPPEAVILAPLGCSRCVGMWENRFPVSVRKVRRLGQLVDVVVAGSNSGFELNVVHTDRGLETVGLEIGSRLYAMVAATAIQVYSAKEME